MQEWHCPVPDCLTVIETEVEPYQNTAVVQHLYHQHLLSTIDVARVLGTDQALVHYRLAQSGVPCRSFSEAQKIRQQRYPLSKSSRAKLRRAGLGRHYSKMRNERVSRGMRAYWYGMRIIRKLHESGSNVELMRRSPSEVGRAMMGIQETG